MNTQLAATSMLEDVRTDDRFTDCNTELFGRRQQLLR